MTASFVRIARLCAMLVLAPALVIPQAGCGRITLISSYDEQIDHSATELQRRMDAFLTMLADKEGTPQASYESNKSFYSDYAVDLRSLKVRAVSQPKNQITGQQIDLMTASLEELRKAHHHGRCRSDLPGPLQSGVGGDHSPGDGEEAGRKPTGKVAPDQ
jgi:hypothetical protein